MDEIIKTGEKTCTKCKISKPFIMFYIDKRRPYPSLQSECKECHNIMIKLSNSKNEEKVKKTHKMYYEKNKKKIREMNKNWYLDNLGKATQYNKDYYAQNKEKINEINKKWREKNKDKEYEDHKKWRANNKTLLKEQSRRANDKKRSTTNGKLNCNMSCAIYLSIVRGSKNHKKWESLVGYTVDDLKKHLEKQFKHGMSWDNYGQWHIDHKIPLSAFNFQIPSDIDFKKAWSLKNLQPLWAVENIKKGANLNKPHQPSLLI